MGRNQWYRDELFWIILVGGLVKVAVVMSIILWSMSAGVANIVVPIIALLSIIIPMLTKHD